MGTKLSAEPVTTPPSSQGLLIDASGNICQPDRNARPPAGIQLQSSRPARFSTLSDRPSGEGVQQGQGRPQSGLHAVFPRFTFRSVVGVFAVVQVIVYVASCWIMTPRGLYTPSGPANWKLGSSDHTMEQCAVQVGGKFLFELRRFVTPIFLHLNVIHLAGNLSLQVSLGPRILATYGAEIYACLFLASGACGNMLSDAFWVGGVGASTSGYGLVGAFLAQCWLIWDSLEEAWREWARNVLILLVVIALAVEAVLWNVVNHYGHLGGLLSGFAIAVMFTSAPPLPIIPANVPVLPASMMKRKQLCGAFLFVFTIACLCKIFVVDPHPTVKVTNINGTLVVVNGTHAFCEQQWANMYA